MGFIPKRVEEPMYSSHIPQARPQTRGNIEEMNTKKKKRRRKTGGNVHEE
jgi:hypothetical protein